MYIYHCHIVCECNIRDSNFQICISISETISPALDNVFSSIGSTTMASRSIPSHSTHHGAYNLQPAKHQSHGQTQRVFQGLFFIYKDTVFTQCGRVNLHDREISC